MKFRKWDTGWAIGFYRNPELGQFGLYLAKWVLIFGGENV